MTHDELQHDLAECRRACGEIVAEKVGLGSWGGNAQLDVATMKPSWAQPNPTAYEVKVSRSDFLADTQAGKYTKYLPYLRRLYFAAPRGLLSKEDIPASCGLIVRGDNGWSVVRAPRALTPDPAKWPVFLQAVLMKHYPGPWAHRVTREDRIRQAEATAEGSLRFRGIQLSERVEKVIREAERARDELQFATADLARRLELEVVNDRWSARDLTRMLDELLRRRPLRQDPSLNQIHRDIESIEHVLGRMRERIPVTQAAS